MPAIPPAALEHLPAAVHQIGGERVEASHAGALEHIYPGSGESVGAIPIAGREEVDLAVAAARAALPGWIRTPANERRSKLLRVAALLREHSEELADITVIDNSEASSARALATGFS